MKKKQQDAPWLQSLWLKSLLMSLLCLGIGESQEASGAGILGGFLDVERPQHHFALIAEGASTAWSLARREENHVQNLREVVAALRLDYTFDISLHRFFALGLGSSLGLDTPFGVKHLDRSFGLRLPGLHTLLVTQLTPEHRLTLGLGTSLIRYNTLRWRGGEQTHELRATFLVLPEILFSWDYKYWKEASLRGQARWMRAFFERPRQARERPENVYGEHATLSLGVGIVYSF